MTDSTTAVPGALSAASLPTYSDTQAMDDIQALLTSPGRSTGEAAIGEMAEIVQRTGRSIATPRLMVLKLGIGKNGLPYAVIDAEGTVIRASQDPDSGAIRVTILAMNSLDEQHLRGRGGRAASRTRPAWRGGRRCRARRKRRPAPG